MKRTAGPSSSCPGREYYTCDYCGNKFEWADRSRNPQFDQEVGPECKCGTVTVQRAVKEVGPNKGRKFWGCAKWPKGCEFFQFRDEVPLPTEASASSAVPGSPESRMASYSRKRPALQGYASYFVDWNKVRLLEEMINAGRMMGKKYDGFEVAAAWKISNKTRQKKYQDALIREHTKNCSSAPLPLDFPNEMEAAIQELGQEQLSKKAGEVFLLHGTAPGNLHSILFQGLDPLVASNGRFGRGVYFAENVSVQA